MIVFEADHADFHACLRDFAKELGTSLNQDTLTFPSQYGEGYMRAIRLPNGLSVLIADCSTETDMDLRRTSSEPPFFILGFDEVYIKRNYSHQIGNEKLSHLPPLYSGAYLNCTMCVHPIISVG